MNDSLQNKVALLNGAGSGIGAAAARRLAQAGARVALLSRTQEELEQVARSIGPERLYGIALILT